MSHRSNNISVNGSNWIDGNDTKKVRFSQYYSSNFKQSVRVKGHDTGVKSLSQENSAAKMDEDRRQTCESAANLCKPQLHWSMFHPCCEKWSSSLVWGQRHVQWPFVDLEKPQEKMRLFFILWWFFSSDLQDAADPSPKLIRPKLILLLFCYYSFIERWCSVAVQSKSIKPNSVAWGCLCEVSLCALQKHLRSVCTWNGRGHMYVATFSQGSKYECHLGGKQNCVLRFIYLLITLRERCKSTVVFLKPLQFG